MEREQLNRLVERAVDGDVQALTDIYYMQYNKVYYASITGLNGSNYSGTEEQRYKVSLEWLLFQTQTNL